MEAITFIFEATRLLSSTRILDFSNLSSIEGNEVNGYKHETHSEYLIRLKNYLSEKDKKITSLHRWFNTMFYIDKFEFKFSLNSILKAYTLISLLVVLALAFIDPVTEFVNSVRTGSQFKFKNSLVTWIAIGIVIIWIIRFFYYMYAAIFVKDILDNDGNVVSKALDDMSITERIVHKLTNNVGYHDVYENLIYVSVEFFLFDKLEASVRQSTLNSNLGKYIGAIFIKTLGLVIGLSILSFIVRRFLLGFSDITDHVANIFDIVDIHDLQKYGVDDWIGAQAWRYIVSRSHVYIVPFVAGITTAYLSSYATGNHDVQIARDSMNLLIPCFAIAFWLLGALDLNRPMISGIIITISCIIVFIAYVSSNKVKVTLATQPSANLPFNRSNDHTRRKMKKNKKNMNI